MDSLLEKANILTEALPYINRLSQKIVVIKYGGNAMLNEDVTRTILQDISILKIVGARPILVHGGGPEINKTLERLSIKSGFVNGLRITDSETMKVVQMSLTSLNKDIASALSSLGVSAIGLCGKDANLINVKKAPLLKDGTDLGYVGEIKKINSDFLLKLIKNDFIPVISSIGADDSGKSFNLNADTAAAAVAAALSAEKLIYLTDVDGIKDKNGALISEITVDEINKLIAEGVITGGMIPKVKACIEGVESGIKRTHIINGTMKHPILLEIFTDKGIGTMVLK
ncbi:MAG: acetylglutamate kinase [Clostridiales bacterium]|jgi:acetylglutamate kinase|nr:acetylglutamate kinase [Clostridiales bacterium]